MFTKGEKLLWSLSTAAILLAFFAFDRENYLTLLASLVGVTSLIYAAKGHPAGPTLMVVFSLMYGIISYSFRYYGELLTYVGMTLPMSLAALVAWIRNPHRGGEPEVKVERLEKRQWLVMWLLTAAVTAAFFFVLRALGTANLIPSTVSVTTSFAAVYLTWRRSPFYALAYAANDVVLILLWLLAAAEDAAYFSVAVCFCTFLVNDLYGFASWRRMAARQAANA